MVAAMFGYCHLTIAVNTLSHGPAHTRAHMHAHTHAHIHTHTGQCLRKTLVRGNTTICTV